MLRFMDIVLVSLIQVLNIVQPLKQKQEILVKHTRCHVNVF